jgi:hypothetical protein
MGPADSIVLVVYGMLLGTKEFGWATLLFVAWFALSIWLDVRHVSQRGDA